MFDSFGQLVRDIRLTRSILLLDMARDLGITPAELSGIECGRKPIPDWFIPALARTYNIGNACAKTLTYLADLREEKKKRSGNSCEQEKR